jgi:exopolysaccharide/PEP-CTERM locus tyrosine autokinase
MAMSSIEKAIERLGRKTINNAPKRVPVARTSMNENASEAMKNADKLVCKLSFEQLRAQGFLTPDSERSKVAQEYRMLKRPLLMNAQGKGAAPIKHGNLIMIVSALPGEGKTFTSLNLAMSMAMERDTTVLLIDSDVVKPSMSTLLGLHNQPGLIDVLLDEQNLEDIIIRTDMPKLSVLPAGRAHTYSTELLASEQMRRVCTELSERYPDRIVLFDAPPLLATTEAVVLAHLLGQILIVVEAGKTPQHIIGEAITKLDRDKVIGMLLNKSRILLGKNYGYYE